MMNSSAPFHTPDRRQKAYEAAPWTVPPPWTPGTPPPLPKFLTLMLTADTEPNLHNRCGQECVDLCMACVGLCGHHGHHQHI